VAETIENPEEYAGKTLYLTGPEAMDHFKAAEIFSEVLGRKIEYKNPEDETYREEMKKRGFDKSYINAMIAVFGRIKSGEVAQTSDTIENVLDRKPISLKDYVKQKKRLFSVS